MSSTLFFLLLIFFVLLLLLIVAFKKYYTGKAFHNLMGLPIVILYVNSCFLFFHLKDFLINVLKGQAYEVSDNTLAAIYGQTLVMVIQCGLILEVQKVFSRALTLSITQLMFCFLLFWIADDIGIIKPVWYFRLIMALMGYIFVSWVFFQIEDLFATHSQLKSKKDKITLVEKVQEEANRIFKIVLQSVLALGASLGVAMSILYRNGWTGEKQIDIANNAFAMLSIFGLIVLGFAICLGRPYLTIIMRSKEIYQEALKSS